MRAYFQYIWFTNELIYFLLLVFPIKEHEIYSDDNERNAEPLPHVESHCILEIHLVFFQELYKEAEDEYFCQAKSEEETSVQLLAMV